MKNTWEPYFRPTRRVHDSGFRCFECGYLIMSGYARAEKKVIIGTNVDNISNFDFDSEVEVSMDLLLDGNIRLFNYKNSLFWDIPGWSDARIISNTKKVYGIQSDLESDIQEFYRGLDELWEKQNKKDDGDEE